MSQSDLWSPSSLTYGSFFLLKPPHPPPPPFLSPVRGAHALPDLKAIKCTLLFGLAPGVFISWHDLIVAMQDRSSCPHWPVRSSVVPMLITSLLCRSLIDAEDAASQQRLASQQERMD